jgi:hypothetical protein
MLLLRVQNRLARETRVKPKCKSLPCRVRGDTGLSGITSFFGVVGVKHALEESPAFRLAARLAYKQFGIWGVLELLLKVSRATKRRGERTRYSKTFRPVAGLTASGVF